MRRLVCAALLAGAACTAREGDPMMHGPSGAAMRAAVPPIDAAAAAAAFETATFATG